VYCGDRGERFSSISVSSDRKRLLEACNACGSYLKRVASDEVLPFPLVSIEDLETTDLDLLAVDRGYTRPPLKEFDRAGRTQDGQRRNV
jgi:hypothetical protein